MEARLKNAAMLPAIMAKGTGKLNAMAQGPRQRSGIVEEIMPNRAPKMIAMIMRAKRGNLSRDFALGKEAIATKNALTASQREKGIKSLAPNQLRLAVRSMAVNPEPSTNNKAAQTEILISGSRFMADNLNSEVESAQPLFNQ